MKFRPCTWISRWLRLSNLHKSWYAQEPEISDFLNSLESRNTSLSLIRLTLPSFLNTTQKLRSVLQVRWHSSLDLQPPSVLATNPINKVKSQCNRARELLGLSRRTMNWRSCRTQSMCTGRYKEKRHWELEYGKWKANLHKRVFIDKELLSVYDLTPCTPQWDSANSG